MKIFYRSPCSMTPVKSLTISRHYKLSQLLHSFNPIDRGLTSTPTQHRPPPLTTRSPHKAVPASDFLGRISGRKWCIINTPVPRSSVRPCVMEGRGGGARAKNIFSCRPSMRAADQRVGSARCDGYWGMTDRLSWEPSRRTNVTDELTLSIKHTKGSL